MNVSSRTLVAFIDTSYPNWACPSNGTRDSELASTSGSVGYFGRFDRRLRGNAGDVDAASAVNMQICKTSVADTMHDLIVSTISAAVVGVMGRAHLRTGRYSFVAEAVRAFVRRNPHLFRKSRRRKTRLAVEALVASSRGSSSSRHCP